MCTGLSDVAIRWTYLNENQWQYDITDTWHDVREIKECAELCASDSACASFSIEPAEDESSSSLMGVAFAHHCNFYSAGKCDASDYGSNSVGYACEKVGVYVPSLVDTTPGVAYVPDGSSLTRNKVESCPAGRYQSGYGVRDAAKGCDDLCPKTYCTQCPRGWYAEGEGNMACTECIPPTPSPTFNPTCALVPLPGPKMTMQPHADCVSPFYYNGVWYEGCAPPGGPQNRQWCSPDTHFSGVMKYCSIPEKEYLTCDEYQASFATQTCEYLEGEVAGFIADGKFDANSDAVARGLINAPDDPNGQTFSCAGCDCVGSATPPPTPALPPWGIPGATSSTECGTRPSTWAAL